MSSFTSTSIPSGHFAYVYVPADNTISVSQHSADKAGGLERDALRLTTEKHFSQYVPSTFVEDQEKVVSEILQAKGVDNNPEMIKASVQNMAGAVEIVALLLPCLENGFIGVSMYCDQNGKTKNLPLNPRATSIAQCCGSQTQVFGDAFFGRYHDDESLPWARLDFTIEDLRSDASWVKESAKRNQGRQMGAYSTSGVLQNMLNSQNTAAITGDTPSITKGTVSEINETEFIAWTQNKEEMEVRIKLPVAMIKPSELDVKIHSKKLQVLMKSGAKIGEVTASNPVSQIVQVGGAELYGSVDPDCSAWTLDKSKAGEVTVVVTLAKNQEANWPQLTK